MSVGREGQAEESPKQYQFVITEKVEDCNVCYLCFINQALLKPEKEEREQN